MFSKSSPNALDTMCVLMYMPHSFLILLIICSSCDLGYRTLRQDVEEGICQVIASMWLESQILSISDSNNASTSHSSDLTPSRKGSRSPFEKKLSKFFKHQMATDTSVVYGNGFRAGHQAVIEFGLQKTLDHIKKTGKFPH